MFSVKDIKSSSKTLTKEQVVEMFPNVFDEGLGLFEGEYQQPPIKPGETVRIRVPGSTMWQPAISIREVTPRSYYVRVGETVFPLQSKRPLAYRRGSTVRYAFGPLNFTVFKRNYASARRATYSVRTHRDQPSLTPNLLSHLTYRKCCHPRSGDLRDSAGLPWLCHVMIRLWLVFVMGNMWRYLLLCVCICDMY